MSLKSLWNRNLTAFLAVATVLGNSSAACAQEILTDTLGSNPWYTYTNLAEPMSIAGGFVLADGPWTLTDITVRIGVALDDPVLGIFSSTVGTISGSLWSDAGGSPGVEMVALNLSGSTLQARPPDLLTFTPGSTVVLAANTQYWFVARTGDPGHMNFTPMSQNTGLHGSPAGAALRVGDQPWQIVADFNAPAMKVRGSSSGTNGGGGAVPEPSEWAAMGVLGMALGGLALRKRRIG